MNSHSAAAPGAPSSPKPEVGNSALPVWQDGVTRSFIKQHAVTVKFGPALGPLLESAARVSGRSKNAIVREAVERHLQRQPAAGTFGEIAKRFAGCIRGTPRDLSTHPRFLEHFGR